MPGGYRPEPRWRVGVSSFSSRAAWTWSSAYRSCAAAFLPYEIREAYWWKDIAPQIDDMVRQRIRWDDYQRYLADPRRPAFLQELRHHEIGGRPTRVGPS